VTSNPAIFEKAILGSTDYDEQIAELAEQRVGRRAIYEEIAISTCSWPATCCGRSGTRRGGATASSRSRSSRGSRTTPRARSSRRATYWEPVDRPNLMIKIPGTEEGVPAIEEAIAEGSTSTSRCCSRSSPTRRSRGLHPRHGAAQEAGESLDVHSVASFFVSRVDTEVDKRLAELGREDLRGIAAVANARAAYQRFKELFRGDALRRAARRRRAGAAPAVGVDRREGPALPETKYVDVAGRAATRSTRCRCPRCSPAPSELEVEGATADQDPADDLSALAERRDRHGRRDESCCATGSRSSSSRSTS
jgi:transaldolase